MKDRLMILATCIIAMIFLAGCKGPGGSAGIFGTGGSGSSDSDDVPVVVSGGSYEPVPPVVDGGHLPEPATMALLGSGLFAYALLRRKKKK